MKTLFKEIKSRSLPYYAQATHISPLCHITVVTSLMEEICDCEKVSPSGRKILMIAAQLHDVGICNCKMRKVVESELRALKGGAYDRMLAYMIDARLEHMREGWEIARRLLWDYRYELAAEEYTEILRLVRMHDMWKIQKYKDISWVFRDEDPILQYLVEADTLWMLTPEGIETDINRGSGMTRVEQMKWNIKVLKDGTLYKSKTGKAIFKRLTGGAHDKDRKRSIAPRNAKRRKKVRSAA